MLAKVKRIVRRKRSKQRRLERFEQLYSQYALLSSMQVQGESVYAGRTGVITLAQGLLLSVFSGLASANSGDINQLRHVIAFTGCMLSILWYFFEQRNNIYYKARGSVLSDMEERLVVLGDSLDLDFSRFWTEVGLRVRRTAKWNEKFSAPLILRTLVPLMFALAWFATLIDSLNLIAWSSSFLRKL